MRRFRLFFVLVLVVLPVLAFTLVAARQSPTFDVDALPVGAEEVVADALHNLAHNAPDAEVVELRLGYRAAVMSALGGDINYDFLDDLPSEIRSRIQVHREDPVWVVAVATDNVEHLPMFAQGPVSYHGFIAVYSAKTGGWFSLSSMKDPQQSEDLASLRQLPDLSAEALPAEEKQRLIERVKQQSAP